MTRVRRRSDAEAAAPARPQTQEALPSSTALAPPQAPIVMRNATGHGTAHAARKKKARSLFEQRRSYLYDYFRKVGLSPVHSAAIVGNLVEESANTLDPDLHQYGGGPGHGIAQWNDPGPRWSALEAFAKKRGESPLTVKLQAAFIWHELNTNPTYKPALAALRKAKGIKQSVDVFEEKYEAAGDPHLPVREADAEAVLKAYKGR